MREEVYSKKRIWLDKGVDGFRMDVIPFISKRLEWPEGDWNDFPKIVEEVYANGPRLHEFLHEMHNKALADYDVTTVGEAPGVPAQLGNMYVGESRKELDMIFHFGHMFLDWGPGGKFDIADWDLRLRGTPSIYQGSEIGMTNVAFPSIDDYRDIETVNEWREAKEQGRDLDQLLAGIHKQGRDNVRTPVHWDDSPNAGFTTAEEPWIKVNPNYPSINAKAVLAEPNSTFYFYQKLLRLRKQYEAWVYGQYEMIDGNDTQLYAYRRWDEEGEFYFYLNFSESKLSELPGPPLADMELVVGNYTDQSTAHLRPWEARVYRAK